MAETLKLQSGTVANLVRKGVLAWIGALVVIQDEVEGWVQALIERGELAEAEGRKYIDELMAQRKASSAPRKVARKARKLPVRARFMDWCLRQAGRPTNRETQELSARIEALEARISALALP